MSEPILVVCPTRDRPDNFDRMCDSVFRTSDNARIVAYVDEDQADEYAPCARNGLTLVRGPRVGPIAAANRIVKEFKAEIYGMVPDDAVFRTPKWDEWLLAQVRKFPKRIGVVSAGHNSGSFMNFPWVTKEWVDLIGYFYYPANFHHCADTILEFMAEPTSMIDATHDEFFIEHVASPTVNQDRWGDDVMRFARWCANERPQALQKIREALACQPTS